MSNLLLLREIQNLKEVIDESLQENSSIVTSYEIKENNIITQLLGNVKECRGKLQTSTNPNDLIVKLEVYKEMLQLYGVKV